MPAKDTSPNPSDKRVLVRKCSEEGGLASAATDAEHAPCPPPLQGSEGYVFKATYLGQEVAVKKMNPGKLDKDPRARELFMREVGNLYRMHHANILTVSSPENPCAP